MCRCVKSRDTPENTKEFDDLAQFYTLLGDTPVGPLESTSYEEMMQVCQTPYNTESDTAHRKPTCGWGFPPVQLQNVTGVSGCVK